MGRDIVPKNIWDPLAEDISRLLDMACRERSLQTAFLGGRFPQLCARCPVRGQCEQLLEDVAGKSSQRQFDVIEYDKAMQQLFRLGILRASDIIKRGRA